MERRAVAALLTMDRIVLSGGWSGEWEGEDGEYEEYRAILALQSHPALGALRGRLQAAAAIDGLPEERRGKLHEDGLLDSWGALGCFDDEQGVRVPPWYPPDLVPPDDVPELPTVSGFLCDDCGQRAPLPHPVLWKLQCSCGSLRVTDEETRYRRDHPETEWMPEPMVCAPGDPDARKLESWKPDKVSEWLTALGLPEDLVAAAKSVGTSGTLLLLMRTDDWLGLGASAADIATICTGLLAADSCTRGETADMAIYEEAWSFVRRHGKKRQRETGSGEGGAAVAAGAGGGASAGVGATPTGQPPAKKQANPRPAVPRCCDGKYRLPGYLVGALDAITALGASGQTGAGQVTTNAGLGWTAASSVPTELRAVLNQHKRSDGVAMHGGWCRGADCPPTSAPAACANTDCLAHAGRLRLPPVGLWYECPCRVAGAIPQPP